MENTEFHEMRRKGIGASDIAAIMGKSPWSTPYQVWLEKTGRAEPKKDNYAMARGREYEPVAREVAEQKLGSKFPSKNVECKELSCMRASLDGYSALDGKILEIKVGKIPTAIPEHYMLQVQHQLICTPEALDAFLFYYDPETTESAAFPIERNSDLMVEISSACKKFWTEHVEADVAPELSEGDYIECTEPMFEIEASAFKAAKAQLEKAEATMEQARMCLEDRLGKNPGMKGFGLTLCRYTRKGAIEYGKIEALKGIDLEKFRKKSIQVFKISESK